MAKKRRERVERHQESLGEQLENPETYGVRTKPRAEKRRKGRTAQADGSDEDDEAYVPQKLSGRILEAARQQQEEVDAEAKRGASGLGHAREALAAAMQSFPRAENASDSDDEQFSDVDEGLEKEWEAEITAEDDAALAAFLAPGAENAKQKTLSDIIMEKIREKQSAAGLPMAHR